jgi:hypothetical protein
MYLYYNITHDTQKNIKQKKFCHFHIDVFAKPKNLAFQKSKPIPIHHGYITITKFACFFELNHTKVTKYFRVKIKQI